MKTFMLLTVAFLALLLIGCEKEVFDADSGSFKDSRDGNRYKWVKIGEQVWMAENLAYLPDVGPAFYGSVDSNHYYVYDYEGYDVNDAKKEDNYKNLGVLYNLPSALEACPEDWHLPEGDEWSELIDYLSANGYGWDGNSESIGKSLASKSGWDDLSEGRHSEFIGNDQTSNNSSGFNAFPAGGRIDHSNLIGRRYLGFTGLGYTAAFWSTYSARVDMDADSDRLWGYWRYGWNGFSVRCVKNDGN
jgi:uncharacterized protein (TIGR02145 family)